MNVGVMKDYKLRDLLAFHTLGWGEQSTYEWQFVRIFTVKLVMKK